MSLSNKYLEAKLVAPKTWSITGQCNDLMYLLEGDQRAMLIDTGMGVGDLKGLVGELTQLPLVVVNTHGHPDHSGGNSVFDEVYLNTKDIALMKEMCTDRFRSDDLKGLYAENPELVEFLLQGMVPYKDITLKPLEAGDVFDLGGRRLEVIDLPGHTAGSVCLLDTRNRILFSGDGILSTPVWLYLHFCTPLARYYNSLLNVQQRAADFDTIFPSHHPIPCDPCYLPGLMRCVNEVLAGCGVGTLFKTFAGEGLLYRHEKGAVIYNPDNLYET